MGEYLDAEPAARQRLGGIGKTKFYELLAAGELRSVRLGRRRLVVGSSIDEYISRLQNQQLTRLDHEAGELIDVGDDGTTDQVLAAHTRRPQPRGQRHVAHVDQH